MASSSNLGQFVEGLSGTDYERYLSGSKTLSEIERGLAEVFTDKLAALLSVAEGGEKEFLKAYLRKYEVMNLAWILRMKAGRAPREEVEKILLSTERLGGMELKPIFEAEGIEALREIIRRSKAYVISSGVMDPLRLEFELWKSHYQRVLKLALRGRLSDSREVRRFLGLELDLVNLKTCILALLRGWPPDKIRELLIANPAGTSLGELQALLERRDPQAFVNEFGRFREFLEKAILGEEWAMEIERLKIMKKYADSERVSKFISFFYVLRYILGLEIEYRNLRAIAVAIYHNLPPEVRRSLLITG